MKRRKKVALLCSVSMLMLSVYSSGAYAVSGGTGEASSPYLIATAADFYDIAADPSANYKIVNDIELSYEIPETDFSGTLDGNGCLITYSGDDAVFSKISGTVTDLRVNNTSTVTTSVLADTITGTVERCSIDGSIASKEGVAGGFATAIDGAVIKDCYSEVSLSGSAQSAGGIAGTAVDSQLTNCYVNGDISGSGSEVGVIIGKAENTSLTSCYYNSSKTSVGFGVCVGSDTTTPLDNSTMKSSASFAGFDFNGTWSIIEGSGTPMLSVYNGRGTAQEPYRIHSGNELMSIVKPVIKDSTKYYELCADISGDITSLGDSDNQFMGHFDGNGYVISSEIGSNSSYNGIFSVIGEGAEVKNITRNVTKYKTATISGGIAAINYGTISGCAVTGEIHSQKDAGGIAGENVGGTIVDCYTDVKVEASKTGAGGIAGFNSYGTIERCASDSTVNAKERTAGGITGDNSYGTIKDCYSLSSVSGTSEIGGITGRLYNGSIIQCYSDTYLQYGKENIGGIYGTMIENGYVENAYYNTDSVSSEYADEQQKASWGKTEQQMMSSGTYGGFDFSSVWAIDEGRNIPTLRSVNGSGTKEQPYIIRFSSDFEKIKKERKLYYKLANNIDISSPGGGTFTGAFDGNGKTVTVYGNTFYDIGAGAYVGNLNIVGSGSKLANSISGAKIEYCTVDNQNKSRSIPAGFANDVSDSEVKNCKVINVTVSQSTAGGFASSISGGTVQDCYVVNSDIAGNSIAGGFAGRIIGAQINRCGVYNSSVTGTNTLGGFVGRSDNGSKLTDCYTNADVSTGQYAGLFVGMNYAEISGGIATGKSFAASNDDAEASPSPAPSALPQPTQTITMGFAGLDEGTTSECTTTYSGNIYKPAATLLAEGSVSLPDIGTDAPVIVSGLTDISGHWAEATILKLVDAGVIDGYDDNTFRPQNGVTKAEFIKLMLAADKVSIKDGFTAYEDANKSWAKNYIYTAITMGLCDNINESETMFGADSIITRVEAAAMMGRLTGPGMSGTPSFPDTDQIPQWALNPVYACESLGLMNGMDDNSFAPSKILTRAEAATIVERIMNMK